DLSEYFQSRMAAKLSETERQDLAAQLARLASQPAMQELLADAVRSSNSDVARIAVRAMARAGLKKVPNSWCIELTAAFLRDDLVADAVATARAWNVGPQAPAHFVLALNRIGADEKASEPLRMSAFAAVPPGKLQL